MSFSDPQAPSFLHSDSPGMSVPLQSYFPQTRFPFRELVSGIKQGTSKKELLAHLLCLGFSGFRVV